MRGAVVRIGTLRRDGDYKPERTVIETPDRPPTTYLHWTGQPRTLPEDGTPFPGATWVDSDDDTILALPYPATDRPSGEWEWYPMGWVRRPTRAGLARAVFDWRHGRLMGYPRTSVLAWVLRHSLRAPRPPFDHGDGDECTEDHP